MDCLVGAKERHDGRQPKRHTGGRGAYPYAGRHDMKLYTLAKGISLLSLFPFLLRSAAAMLRRLVPSLASRLPASAFGCGPRIPVAVAKAKRGREAQHE